ncbi:MAG: RNA polymerase sigma factor region1.1 domain-containing protein, partial [Acidimicrobiales bacterium]|nr:RNA polymerase sigma factor region1.1 domain-containing protein [Acidimicrobiales bacterium]
MSEGAEPLSVKGLREEDLLRLLATGRQRGVLTQDDLMAVLEDVELSASLIDAVVARVRAEGVAYVEDVDEDAEPFGQANGGPVVADGAGPAVRSGESDGVGAVPAPSDGGRPFEPPVTEDGATPRAASPNGGSAVSPAEDGAAGEGRSASRPSGKGGAQSDKGP